MRCVRALALRPSGRLPRRPAFLAPPWPLFPASRLTAREPGVTLHTIQTARAYGVLRAEGRLVGDGTLAEERFAEAYGWMDRQMTRRLDGPGHGILWSWAATSYRDLARHCRHARGDVLLTVRLPRERVLLSHFDLWHDVLNRTPGIATGPDGELPRDWEEELDAWWERTREHEKSPLAEWPPALRGELESSWEQIFDAETLARTPYVQATVRELRADDVVRAVRIV
jgi:hypothetical protein